MDHFGGVGDAAVAQAADVDEAVLMHTDIDKAAEVGDIGDDPRQHHADGKVVDGVHVFVELEHFELRARVAAGFVKLVHDVLQRGHPDRGIPR